MVTRSDDSFESVQKQLLSTFTTLRQSTPKQKPARFGHSDFGNVLSSTIRKSTGRLPSRRSGMTLADYRANPVTSFPAIRARNTALCSEKTPAETKESPIKNHPINAEATERRCAPAAERTGKKPSGNDTRETIERCIDEAATDYHLSPRLIRAVIRAESNFNVTALSPAGAQGLMQLMPGTAGDLGVEDPFDINQNIDAGARYLRKMLDMFSGNERLALAAYNAGPGAVMRYGDIPPYRETQAYIEKVLKFKG